MDKKCKCLLESIQTCVFAREFENNMKIYAIEANKSQT
jgi:hypothetical protein